MTTPFERPKRKDPLVRTELPLTPPGGRSRAAHLLTRAAARGQFALPRCRACGTVHFPVRDICPNCLSTEIAMAPAAAAGTLLSRTQAEVPALPYFRERAPWHVGLVQLADGPQVIAHLHPEVAVGAAVRMHLKLDKAGQAVLYAAPKTAEVDLMTDPKWREMVAHPLHRRVLITDARHFATPAIVKALKAAGARKIRLGVPEAWKPFREAPLYDGIEGVEILPLDLTSDRSVFDYASDYGGTTEIVINTADRVRAGQTLQPGTLLPAQEMMEHIAFGPMRLAQALAPALIGRGADGPAAAAAWVNLLSIHALAPLPGHMGWSAAHAAAHAFSQGLRAELLQGGVKLINLYSGPTEDPWFQTMIPPKVNGAALARGIVKALTEGLEELDIGPVAQELRERLDANPKAVERELGQS
ncbi:SDR family NAD(P)-dependent oxidoreductase [Pseudodonghicola flavimaris]|uniref:SDR family NAD(P)-dependent oxidoreductase n=1 Tax=Pseudodonghicola flavimaris TaxID=3050036 RepID=A0ABT7EYA2_9RHOB|nr:SDR family NAD(P)-dependent oxidoreductase [Pseudodonghicola flavimaris]MDK3017299.1 SDR family NAD(P)-dependent oxidoreductase [Pseudodonghicola flavimaris]